ncbi:hypothetical protein PENTCL1PPCAC_9834, partial [Pristionchus entomophagus]
IQVFDHVQIVLLELIVGPVHHIAPLDVDKLVTVGSALFVKESDRVHQLMNNCADLDAARVEGQWLPTARLSHQRVASVIGVDVDVVLMPRWIASNEANARLVVVFLHSLGDHTPRVRSVLRGHRVRDLTVRPAS